MVLSRRAILGMGAALALTGCAGARRRKLVVVAARGGWDPTFTVDPKAADEVEGPEVHATGASDDVDEVATFAGIQVKVNPVRRPSVTRFFEAHGARTVVVNGVDVGSISHVACTRRMWTGSDGDAPDVATLAGVLGHPTLPIGCLDLGPGVLGGHLGSGVVRIGRTGQVAELVVPTAGFDADTARIARWRAKRAGDASLRLWEVPESDSDAVRRAATLPRALDGLSLNSDDAVGSAVAALRAGVCGSVYLDTRLGWDTHEGNAEQDVCWESLFQTLGELTDALNAEGLLDQTLVLVISEMGRPPLRNSVGGKDHWPVTSAMLIGGGIAGGRVIGSTDGGLAPVMWEGATISPSRLVDGVLAHLGVEAHTGSGTPLLL